MTPDVGLPAAAVAQGAVPIERASLLAGKLLFWLPVVPLVALDLWSKTAAFARPSTIPLEVWHWPGVVRFSLVKTWNTGTIWGLFQNVHGPLVVLRCVALVLIVWFAARTAREGRSG